MDLVAGVDIGGTECTVCLGRVDGVGVGLVEERRFATPGSSAEAIDGLCDALESLAKKAPASRVSAIGICCGGPLDTTSGTVLSPPNLPGWDRIDVVTPFRELFGVPVALQNDANACALAEWRWGAGRGLRNLIFLTFGTGMGAGLILEGRLYTGANGMAGEVGHVRLADGGPAGYGKKGSFEGFCSGGGIARLARALAEERLKTGPGPLYSPARDDLPGVTAEKVAEAAVRGDPLAREVFETAAFYLGRGLAMLVDVLNPERIIVGGIYARRCSILEPLTLKALEEEALGRSLEVCKVVPAGLGGKVGTFASLAVALNVMDAEPE